MDKSLTYGFQVTLPPSLVISPSMAAMRELFPEPKGPTMTVRRPCWKVSHKVDNKFIPWCY